MASYINAILDCLQNKKYCEAIMDELLLFTLSKNSHIAKLEDLLKALLKWFENIPKEMSVIGTNLHYMRNEIFIRTREFALNP